MPDCGELWGSTRILRCRCTARATERRDSLLGVTHRAACAERRGPSASPAAAPRGEAKIQRDCANSRGASLRASPSRETDPSPPRAPCSSAKVLAPGSTPLHGRRRHSLLLVAPRAASGGALRAGRAGSRAASVRGDLNSYGQPERKIRQPRARRSVNCVLGPGIDGFAPLFPALC